MSLPADCGYSFGTQKCMMAAGKAKLTMEGKSREKKCANGTTPFIHANKVVISPKGLKDPPVVLGHGHYHGAHQKRCGEVIPHP